VRGLLTVSKKIIYQNIAFNSLLMLPEGIRGNFSQACVQSRQVVSCDEFVHEILSYFLEKGVILSTSHQRT